MSSHYGIREEVWLHHWKKLLRVKNVYSQTQRSLASMVADLSAGLGILLRIWENYGMRYMYCCYGFLRCHLM